MRVDFLLRRDASIMERLRKFGSPGSFLQSKGGEENLKKARITIGLTTYIMSTLLLKFCFLSLMYVIVKNTNLCPLLGK